MPTVFRGVALAFVIAALFAACQSNRCPAESSCADGACSAEATCPSTGSAGATCPATGACPAGAKNCPADAATDCGDCDEQEAACDAKGGDCCETEKACTESCEAKPADCSSCPKAAACTEKCTSDCDSCESKAPAGLLQTLSASGAKELWSAQRFDGCCVLDAFAVENDLFAVVASREGYEIHCIDLTTGVPRWLTNIGTTGLRTRPTVGDALVVCLLSDGAGMVTMKRRNGSISDRRSVPMKLVPMGGGASSPTTVYVASLGDNAVHAVNPSDGLDGWRYRTEGNLFGAPVMTPALPRRLVVIAADNGEVVALPSAGWDEGRPAQAAWTRKLLGPMSAPVATYGVATKNGGSSMVLAPCEDHGLYCLDAASGESRWVYRTASAFRSQPQAAGGKAFAVNCEGMQVVDLATGAALWQEAKGAPAACWRQACRMVAANASTVYLTCGKGVARLDANTGKLLGMCGLAGVDFLVETGDSGLLVGVTRCGQIAVLK